MRQWIFVVAALAALQGARPASGPVFDRVLPLAANEGVFAYARISPDGRFLAYASEMPDPVQPRVVRTTQTVVDLAYYADGRATALVTAARAAGCEVVDGLEALVRQGAASFEHWTGVAAPVGAMRSALGLDR